MFILPFLIKKKPYICLQSYSVLVGLFVCAVAINLPDGSKWF